jgi:hypothetical protein
MGRLCDDIALCFDVVLELISLQKPASDNHMVGLTDFSEDGSVQDRTRDFKSHGR